MLPSWRWGIIVRQFQVIAITRGLPAQTSGSPAIILTMGTVRWRLRRSLPLPIPLALPLVSGSGHGLAPWRCLPPMAAAAKVVQGVPVRYNGSFPHHILIHIFVVRGHMPGVHGLGSTPSRSRVQAMQFPGSFRGFLIVWRSHRTHTGRSLGRRCNVAEVLDGTGIQMGSGVALSFHRMPVPHPIPLLLSAAVAMGSIQGLRLVLISVNGVPLARIVVRVLLLLLMATIASGAATAAMPKLPFVVAPAQRTQLWVGVGMPHGGSQTRVVARPLGHLHGASERGRRLGAGIALRAHGSLAGAGIPRTLGCAGAHIAADAPVQKSSGMRAG